MPNFLIVQRGAEIGRRFDLNDTLTTLGRSADNDIELDDPYVSRYQAVIKKQGDNLVVIDLGSENPVLIRDTPLEPGEPYVLQHRDVVRIGQNVFSFINSAAIPARPSAPAIDSYQAVPSMPSSQSASYAPPVVAPVNQVPYQPVNPQPAFGNVGSGQNSSPSTPAVVEVDEGATVVGTNFGSAINNAAKSSNEPPAPTNPAVSYSYGSFGGTDSGNADAKNSPEASTTVGGNYSAANQPSTAYNYGSTTDGVSQPNPAISGYNQYGQYQSSQPSPEDSASTTIMNAGSFGSAGQSNPTANEPPSSSTPYSQNPSQYDYNQSNQYGQSQSQYGQGQQSQQYGQYGQGQQQYNQYGQYGQNQAQPGQSQSQSGYGQGSQSQSQYGQYNQQPQSQYYGQYGQPGAYPNEANPAPDASKKEEKPAEKPKEEYSLEDAPTTIIRIDKTKL